MKLAEFVSFICNTLMECVKFVGLFLCFLYCFFLLSISGSDIVGAESPSVFWRGKCWIIESGWCSGHADCLTGSTACNANRNRDALPKLQQTGGHHQAELGERAKPKPIFLFFLYFSGYSKSQNLTVFYLTGKYHVSRFSYHFYTVLF